MADILSFITIPDQKGDLQSIAELIAVTNIGLEAITYVYDDHRVDPNTFSRMLVLRENLVYRIFAAYHQYELLIEGLKNKKMIDMQSDPYDGDLHAHPTVYRFSNELNSIVDSIFFHLCSVFDYLAHFLSYVVEKNKDRTLDWDAFANKSRGIYREKFKMAQGVIEIDNKLRIKLEKHRSILIHRKRDLSGVGISIDRDRNQLSLVFSETPATLKDFKNIIMNFDSSSKYTLECLPSAVFYQTLQAVHFLIEHVRVDLVNTSVLKENGTKSMLRLKSEEIWAAYKLGQTQYYHTHRQSVIM